MFRWCGNGEIHELAPPNAKGKTKLDIIDEERTTIDTSHDDCLQITADQRQQDGNQTNIFPEVVLSVVSPLKTKKLGSKIRNQGSHPRYVCAPRRGTTGISNDLTPQSNYISVTATRDKGPTNADLMARTKGRAETEEEKNMLFFGHLFRNKLPCYEVMKDRTSKTSQELTVRQGDVLRLESAAGPGSSGLVVVSNYRGIHGLVPNSILVPKHYSTSYSLSRILTGPIPSRENEEHIYMLNQLGVDAYRVKATSGVRTRTMDGRYINLPFGTVVQIVREVPVTFSKLPMSEVRTSRGDCCRICVHLLERIA